MSQVKNCLAFGCGKPASKILKANVVGVNDLDGAVVDTEIYACPNCATQGSANHFMTEANRMKRDIEKAFADKEYAKPDWDKSSMFWADIPVALILPDTSIKKVSKLDKIKRIGKASAKVTAAK